MNIFRFLSGISAACLLALAVVACDPTGPGTTVTVPGAVTNLQATSTDSTTVRLRWTAPTDSTASSVTGYRITVLSATGDVVGTVNATSTLNDITGLVAGRVYTFRIQSKTKDTVSTGTEIKWSPAVRIRTANNAAIRIYETNSSFGSGLAFQGGTARNLTIASAAQWDIGLDTAPLTAGGPASLDIGSPNQTGYTAFASNGGRKTIVSAMPYNNIDSLNQIFDTQLSVGNAETLINFNNANRGFVFGCRTQEGNYAKVFVKANAQGVLLQGTSPNRYVEVEISYQPVANVPYAFELDKAAAAALNKDLESAGIVVRRGKKVSSVVY